MDLALIDSLAKLGLGALIAGVVLYWKRGDDKQFIAYLQEINKQLLTVISGNTTALVDVQKAVEAQTESLDLIARIREIQTGHQPKRGA